MRSWNPFSPPALAAAALLPGYGRPAEETRPVSSACQTRPPDLAEIPRSPVEPPRLFVSRPHARIHAEVEEQFLQAAGFGMSRLPRMPLAPDAILAAADDSRWKVRAHHLVGIA